MKKNPPIKVDSISQLHTMLGFEKPLHPLISLSKNRDMVVDEEWLNQHFLFNFYKISFKKSLKGKLGYGQGYYDFNEGGMIFTAPNQLLSTTEEDREYEGLTLLIHPDFFRNHQLGTKIRNFGFFSYAANEALYLSDKEKTILFGVLNNIQSVLEETLDDFSHDILIAHIEVLLNYSNRFYKRQFITRKLVNNDVLEKIDSLMNDYFDEGKALDKGLPTVEFLASELHFSPRYLSDLLRSLIGQNAQQLIHEKLIEKSKEYLTNSKLSVSEIAYQLGFEHSQSLSKLFKKKTNQTPVEYRQSFN